MHSKADVDAMFADSVPMQVEVPAHEPIGLRKDLHIAMILEMPGVYARWTAAKGYEPTQADIDAMIADFVPMQVEVLVSIESSRTMVCPSR